MAISTIFRILPASVMSGVDPQAFSLWRRQRLKISRVLVFSVVGLGFAFTALQNQTLFGTTPAQAGLLAGIELAISPLLLLAAFLSWRPVQRTVTSAVQSAAVFCSVAATLVLRHLALTHGFEYPAQMGGIVLIAFAMFGGFAWQRIAFTAAAYFLGAVAVELAASAAAPAAALKEIYASFFMAGIASGGALVHQLLMQFAWKELTQAQEVRRSLQASEERFLAFMDQNPSIAWMKDEQGRYLYANKAFRRFIGVQDDSWRGKSDADYFPEAFAHATRKADEAALRASGSTESLGSASGMDGATRHWSLVRFPFSDRSGRRLLGGIATDITDKRRADNLVRLQALTDELTGLYNRRGFLVVAQEAIQRAREGGRNCALVYIDLDRLKTINQQFGHAGGDTAIFSVGEALRIAANREDIIARVGGDEFLMFTTETRALPGLNTRIAQAIGNYSHSDTVPFKLSATIGIWEFTPEENTDLEKEIARADELMFSNKKWKAGARQT